MEPTRQIYTELQTAFDHFNEALFDGELPSCLLTLQREKDTCGYYSAQRFVHPSGETTDEIALNPTYFAMTPVRGIMQTIVHEMVHLWQFHFGKPGRGRYHNKEWANKMKDIGLQPSDTGLPGGNETGERMSDYPIEGGKFNEAADSLLTRKFRISWADRFLDGNRVSVIANEEAEAEKLVAQLTQWGEGGSAQENFVVQAKKTPTRVKYVCPGCSDAAWGKPSLDLVCGKCELDFQIDNTS